MKHLFFVHSHITFLVANRYLLDQKIEPDDALFVLSARYPNLPANYSNYHTLLYPNGFFENGSSRVFEKTNLVLGLKNIKWVENYLNSHFANDKFILYLINTGSDIHSTIVTMHNCAGYYIMEEGASSYSSKHNIEKLFGSTGQRVLFKILKHVPLAKRFFALKDSIISTNNSKFLGTIATSPKAFPDTDSNHIVVSNPFDSVHLEIEPDAVLSIDASLYLSFKEVFPQEIFTFLSSYFSKNHFSNIAYKFHPCYYSNIGLIEKYRSGIKEIFPASSVELPVDCILENVLNTYSATFVSDFSTIGIYASNFGRTCISYANIVPILYPDSGYKERFLDNMSDVLKTTYQFIDSDLAKSELSNTFE